jgi:hypothetical protein
MALKACFTHSEQQETIKRLVQLGFDYRPIADVNGDGWCGLGGYGRLKKFPIVFAGVMLDAAEILNVPMNTVSSLSGVAMKKFSEDGTTYYAVDGVTALYGEDIGEAESEPEPPTNPNSGKRDPAHLVDAFPGLLPNRGDYHQNNSRAMVPQLLAAKYVTGMQTAWSWDAGFDYVHRWVYELEAYWTPHGAPNTIDIYGYGGTGNEFARYAFEYFWDQTAATLSSPTATKTNSTDATGTVSVNRASGTILGVVSTSSTPPSEAQMRAGQTHTGAAAPDFVSQAVTATGVQNLSFNGLTPATTYYVHYMHLNPTDVASNRVVSASFVTDAVGFPELLPDPGFDDGTKWNNGSGWTISGSKANYAGGGSFAALISQPETTVTPLTNYRATVDVTNITGGASNIVFRISESNGGALQYQQNVPLALGTITVDFTTSSGCTLVEWKIFNLDAAQVFKLDNASLKRR